MRHLLNSDLDGSPAPLFAPLRLCVRFGLNILTVLLLLILVGPTNAQTRPTNLDFEEGPNTNGLPKGWSGGGDSYRLEIDHAQAHGGKASGRIRYVGKPAASANQTGFGTMAQCVDAGPYHGKRIRFAGYLKTQGVTSGWSGLWMRVDGPDGKILGFDNMAQRAVKGTTGWKQYVITLDVPKEGQGICFGFLLAGDGIVWADDLQLTVTGAADPGTPGTTSSQSQMMSGPGIAFARGAYEFTASADLAEPKIAFPLPLLFENQVPLTFDLTTQPADAIKHTVYRERLPHDWIAEVTFKPMKQGERVILKWQSDVLIRPTNISALPKSLPIPSASQLPDDVKPWLAASRSVQAADPEIVKKAKALRGSGDLMQLARNVAEFGPSIAPGKFQSVDAVEALHKGGVCTSMANLAAALLRANGVPTRVLGCYPTWGSPLQTHYIVQFYAPDHGWVWLESTMGRVPHEAYGDVIVSVVYPEDERKSFDAPRWGGAGVPYMSLTENLSGPSLQMSKMLVDAAKFCDHIAGPVRMLTETDSAKWKRAFDLACAVWKDRLERMRASAPIPAALAAAQKEAASAKTLDEMIERLQRAQQALSAR